MKKILRQGFDKEKIEADDEIITNLVIFNDGEILKDLALAFKWITEKDLKNSSGDKTPQK